MKLLRGIVAVILTTVAVGAIAMPATVVRVVDGDTFVIDASLWIVIGGNARRVYSPVRIRLSGVDTPEMRASSACERMLAQRASAYVDAWIGDGAIEVEIRGLDTYAGRVDASVIKSGRDLATDLLEAGLARPYDGSTSRAALGPWC